MALIKKSNEKETEKLLSRLQRQLNYFLSLVFAEPGNLEGWVFDLHCFKKNSTNDILKGEKGEEMQEMINIIKHDNTGTQKKQAEQQVSMR